MEIMQDKIMEILVILMDKLRKHEKMDEQMEIISGELLERGYTEQEISSAISWIIERAAFPKETAQVGHNTYRILNEVEKVFISKDAYGYLLQLHTLDLLPAREMEAIIDKAMLLSTPNLGLDDVKLLAAEALFESGGSVSGNGESYLPSQTVH